MLDAQHMKAQLVTGSAGRRDYRILHITLHPEGTGCRMAVEGVSGRPWHNDKGDLLKRIDEELVRDR